MGTGTLTVTGPGVGVTVGVPVGEGNEVAIGVLFGSDVLGVVLPGETVGVPVGQLVEDEAVGPLTEFARLVGSGGREDRIDGAPGAG